MNNKTQSSGRLITGIDWLVRNFALWIGGILLFGMIALTFADVLLRYIFNAPIYGGQDYGTLMLIVVVAASIAYSGRTGGQVLIELLDTIAPARFVTFVDILVRLISIGALVILVVVLTQDGRHAAEFGESTTTLQISYGPYFYVLALGILLYVVVLLLEVFLLIGGRSIDDATNELFGRE
jgi:TRAP-type C4-dicarboxylate transport system permease small subunit